MTPDEELATAIAGRQHWRTSGTGAVYQPAGSTATVHVAPVLHPLGRERFRAAIVRSGNAEHSVPAFTAVEAVRWAERQRLN